LRDQGRVLSIALRFLLEFCIQENFPNLLHTGLTTRALSAPAEKK